MGINRDKYQLESVILKSLRPCKIFLSTFKLNDILLDL